MKSESLSLFRHSWEGEGEVILVEREFFIARLTNQRPPVEYAEIEATIPLSHISKKDLPMVVEGNHFKFFVVDYQGKFKGHERVIKMQFIHYKKFTKKDIREAYKRAEKKLKTFKIIKEEKIK